MSIDSNLENLSDQISFWTRRVLYLEILSITGKIPKHPPPGIAGRIVYKNIMECITFNTGRTELIHISIENLTHGRSNKHNLGTLWHLKNFYDRKKASRRRFLISKCSFFEENTVIPSQITFFMTKSRRREAFFLP